MPWKNRRLFTSKTSGERVPPEEIVDGIWSVYYEPALLGRLDAVRRGSHA